MSDADAQRWAAIEKYPNGIRVTHTPNPGGATKGGRSGHDYTWLYETIVEAAGDQTIRVTEFGAIDLGRNGPRFTTYLGRPFTSDEFAEWYHCPGALLRPGLTYSDPVNWTGNDRLVSSQTTWYYLGLDENEQLVKGVAAMSLENRVVAYDE